MKSFIVVPGAGGRDIDDSGGYLRPVIVGWRLAAHDGVDKACVHLPHEFGLVDVVHVRRSCQSGIIDQAIGAVANELQQLGYIHREPDPCDTRQVLLMLTSRGQQLLTDSVDSVDALEQELQPLLGADGMIRLKHIAQELYRMLHLEEQVFGAIEAPTEVNLQLLASQLTRQLGLDGSKKLAHLLMSKQG